MASIAKPLTLPNFLNNNNRWYVALYFAILFQILYPTSNHFPIFEPRYLPMTWLDSRVEFIPWTVWIYISEYVFFFVAFALATDLKYTVRSVYAFTFVQVFSVLIFWIYPTTYPRENFPLTDAVDPITHWVFSLLRVIDAPTNCFPSLHVSSTYLFAFVFLHQRQKIFWMMFTWGTAIAITTLTTKQHYFVDVVAGFTLAIFAHWFFYRVIQYRDVGPQAKR